MMGYARSRRGMLASAGSGLAAMLLAGIAPVKAESAWPAKPLPTGNGAGDTPSAIEVTSRPIAAFDRRDHQRLRFGSLAFRSGLVLTSRYPGFGGLSGWRLDPAGERFISFSDKGSWFTGRILYRGAAMTGLADVEAAPMLSADGQPITARGWFDTESIARDGSLIYIGVERVNQVLRFDFDQGYTRARGEVFPMPEAVRHLPDNKGLEAMVFVPIGLPLAGSLIAISERGLDDNGNLIAFLVGGRSPGQFRIRRTAKFDISDAALLPGGDLLILERKFSLIDGVGIRIRRIALSSIKPDTLVDGPAIFEADAGLDIDNMEGIDAHVTAEGETVLTLISDDNFSWLQRTLLLQFTLVA